MYSTSTERERFLLEFFFGLQQQPKNKSRLGYEKKLDSWFQTDSVLQLLTCSMYKLYSMSSLFSYVHIFYFLRVWFIKKLDSCDQPGLDELSCIATYIVRSFQTWSKKAAIFFLQYGAGQFGLLAACLEGLVW